MSYDEFFTDGDKPYAENLNDSLALIDAFDITVPLEMPGMFTNKEFNNNLNVARKCGIGLVTLKSFDEGITIGTDSIAGTGELVFRVYPNFNSFYKWEKIILEKSGTVDIGFKKTDGTNITATVSSDGTISEASALKQLQEIDVVLTLTSATISNILITFINNQTNHTRTNALLEANQLVNVDGTVSDGETAAVSGDTVYAAFEDFSTNVVDDKINDLSDEVDQKLLLKENVANKVNSLSNSSTNYPTCQAVKSVTDGKANSSHTHTSSQITDLLSVLYPKGSIYMSMNENLPIAIANLGTWVKIEGKVLLASGAVPIPWLDNTSLGLVVGDTGGEFWHQLTEAEMPSHTHTQAAHRHDMSVNWSTGSGSTDAVTNTSNRKAEHRYTSYEQPTINETGDDAYHNNMPPYLVVNMWQRTA